MFLDYIQPEIDALRLVCDRAPANLQPLDPNLRSIECVKVDQVLSYDLLVVVRQPDSIRLLSVTLTSPRLLSPTQVQTIGQILALFALVPYDGAQSQQAADWVNVNVTRAGASTTIGEAFFEIPPSSGQGPQPSYRLNIAPRGTIPTK